MLFFIKVGTRIPLRKGNVFTLKNTRELGEEKRAPEGLGCGWNVSETKALIWQKLQARGGRGGGEG